MKKILLLICLFLTTQLHAKETITIGVVCPLTGPVAHIGEEIKNSMVLAAEDVNTKGLVEVKLIFEDDMLQPARAAIAAQKLIKTDKVDALVTASSGTGNVVAPLAEANKIPHIGLASDSKIAKGQYNFIHWTPPFVQADFFVTEARKRRINKISVIELNHQGVLAVTKALEDAMKKEAMPLFKHRFNSGERDFRAIVAEIKTEQPELIFICAFPPELDLIAKQIRDLGLKTPLSCIESFEITQQKEIFNGSWFVSGSAGKGEEAKRFLKRLKDRFNQERLYCGGFAYDTVILFADAFNKNGKKGSNEEAAKFIQEIKDYPSICGKISVDSEGIILSPASLKEIKNGKIEVLE
jgi:branched-chain amino acid transport system substrate-binding protein